MRGTNATEPRTGQHSISNVTAGSTTAAAPNAAISRRTVRADQHGAISHLMIYHYVIQSTLWLIPKHRRSSRFPKRSSTSSWP